MAQKLEQILVIMDAFSKFVTTYMLRTNAASAVFAALKQYFAWAERQACRHTSENIGYTRAAYPVRQLLTDKGDELAGSEFKQWFNKRGIEHLQVGPASSQQSPCEQVHRTIMEMTRAMLQHSRMSRTF